MNQTAKDTWKVAVVAVLMICGSFLALGIENGGAFAITALVWGSILLSIILWHRAHATARNLLHLETMERLGAERIRLELSHSILDRVFDRGLPAGLSVAELRELLETEAPAASGNEGDA